MKEKNDIPVIIHQGISPERLTESESDLKNICEKLLHTASVIIEKRKEKER